MFMAFVASNGILLAALTLTVTLASGFQANVNGFGGHLGVIATGSLVGTIVGRSYGVAIEAVSGWLDRPIRPLVFSAAAFVIVTLACMLAWNKQVTLFDPPYSQPLLMGCLAVSMWCAVEVWPMTPAAVPLPARLVLAVLGGTFLFAFALLAPFWVMKAFVDMYNAGFAAFMSGWVAGLASRQIKVLFGERARLEANAAKDVVKALLARDVPVVVAVLLAYVLARFSGVHPVLLAVGLGAVSAVIFKLVSELIE